MRVLKKKFPLIFLLILSCASSGGNSSGKERVLRIPLASEPPTLDWNIATDNVSFRVITQIMEGLTSINPQGEAVPCLAERWEYNEKELSFTFYLKKGVFWSDGVPLTSRHFIDSLLRLLDPKTGSEYAYFVYDIKGARCFNEGKCNEKDLKVEALGDHILKFYLEKPAVYFPYLFAFMVNFPIRKEVIKGSSFPEPPFPVVGPYIPEEWRHHYKITLRSNPLYHGNQPPVGKIEFYVIEEPLTSLLLFERGFLHLAPLFPVAYEKYREHPSFRQTTVFRGYYYGFNIQKKPVNNIFLRKALAHSIDRREIVKLMRGTASPAVSWIPPGMFAHNPSLGLEFDLKKAKYNYEMFLNSPEGKNAELTIYFNASPENQIVAENIQAQWKKNLGLNVKLEMMEWNAYLQMLNLDPPPVFRLGWGADFPDPHNFMEIFASWSGNNHTNWKNEEYDELIRRGASENNPLERKKIYDRAQKILLEDDAVIIPLFFSSAAYLSSTETENLILTPMDILSLKDVRFRE